MTEYSYPNSIVPNQIVTDESRGLAFGPDAVVEGLGVSLVGVNTLRLGPGLARVGGWAYENTANKDFTVPLNSGVGRHDRLVLRKTWDVGTSEVLVRAVLRTSVDASTVPDNLPRDRGPGSTWEMPLARATVVSGSATWTNWVMDGPGTGFATWTVSQSIPNNTGTDWNIPYAGRIVRGPQPVAPVTDSSSEFRVRIPGYYSVNYQAALPGFTAASWVKLQTPWLIFESAFDSRGNATVDMTGQWNANEIIRPYIFQDSGTAKTASMDLTITRLT